MVDSIQIQQNFNSSGCCVAPYANIGIFDGGARSDQYGKRGSHLPIQLKDIARLQGQWTFKVPVPLNPNWQVEQYRVYFEMFLSGTAAGHAAVLDWAVAKFPNYYTSNLYLSALSLAEEAGAFHGTVSTSYASFAIQKAGSEVVFTPP